MFDIKVKVKHQSKINLKRSQYMNFIIVNEYIEHASERTFFCIFRIEYHTHFIFNT